MKKLIIILTVFLTGCYANVSISDINYMHKYCNSKNTTLVEVNAYSGVTDHFMCSDGVKTMFKND